MMIKNTKKTVPALKRVIGSVAGLVHRVKYPPAAAMKSKIIVLDIVATPAE